MLDILDRNAVSSVLGVTPIAFISDHEIWQIVTPQVLAFLGPFDKSQCTLRETTDGMFVGDQVTNLNGNVIGGDPKKLRVPYLNTLYRTQNGAFVIKRDGFKIKAMGWFGDIDRGTQQLIYSFALRDRRFDGTARANDCSLLDYPYDHPSHTPLPMLENPDQYSSLETSLYSWLPGTRIGATCGDLEFENFVKNPYTFVSQPSDFLRLFKKVLSSDRLPGMFAQPIPDVGKTTHKAFDTLATKAGYDFLETAPSHLHVLLWNMKDGYRITSKDQQETVDRLREGLKRLQASGVRIQRSHEPWIVALQSLPREFIPDEFYLGGAIWPQDNISPINLWLYKPLSERAKLAV